MPIWPFRKRRRNSPKKDEVPAPQTEKTNPGGTSTPTPVRPQAQVQRESSKRRKREATRDDIKATEAGFADEKQRQGLPGKENIPAPRGSIENITALPGSRKLESSPHLRPIDMEPPKIPYSFRGHSNSHTSLQQQTAAGRSSRPATLKSKRSHNDSGTPQRRRSSKKRKDDHLREEEIRSMTAPMPIPKRHGGAGDGLMRRDSKKFRGINRDSNVSLPTEGSIHSSMSGIPEQRGWEVGNLGFFTPRPAVRLSGQAQYAISSSMPHHSPLSPLSPNARGKEKEVAPASGTSDRKRATIGQEADGFDASDLRMLLERDQKRRDKRKIEQQEKLDRKLRREGRHRANSDRRKREEREAEEVKRAEAARIRAVEEARSRRMMTPPTAVHPALRGPSISDERELEAVGLGIATAAPVAQRDTTLEAPRNAIPTTEETGTDNTGTYLNYGPGKPIPENPFEGSPAMTPIEESDKPLPTMPGAFTPLIGTPTEEREPVVSTAQSVRMSRASQTGTPPLSPVSNPRAMSSVSRLSDLRRISTPDNLQPPSYPYERRTSDSQERRRAGAWATFFRRGGTNLKKTQGEDSPSEFSFSNTSRESMARQPVPAHLVVDPPQTQTPVSQRRKSGAPVRTQSKFREDLPELPISPPDSRVQSPDLPTNAAASIAAAQRQAMPPPPKPIDIPGRGEQNIRHSFPDPRAASPSSRAAAAMVSPSLASVDSEGSWLAGGPGGKRTSTQSTINRGFGSLSRRNPDFVASYEELGGDKDAEYLQRTKPSAREDTTVDADEGNVIAQLESAEEPLKVHQSVRRKPTLVHRDPRAQSREGLLTKYATAEPETASLHGGAEETSDYEGDSPEERYPRETRVEKARSVNYGRGHARQMSAGSAKLLDVGSSSKRGSIDASSALSAERSPIASAAHSPAPPRSPRRG